MSVPNDQGLLFAANGQLAYRPAEPPSAASSQRHPTYRSQVLDALRDGPKTDEEICLATGLRGSTVRPRRLELLRGRLIEDSGEVRPTRSGREAIVWRVRKPESGDGCGSI